MAALSIEMTGTATRSNVTPPAKAAGFAAMALALLILRCLPLRMALAVASMIGRLGARPATEPAAFTALALRGYRADWCIGCRLGPAEAHAWIETPAGPVGEPDRPGRPLHVTVRI